MSNFDPNAILRGAQLTVVGGLWFQLSTQKSGRRGWIAILSAQSSPKSRSVQVWALPTGRHRCVCRHSDTVSDCFASELGMWGDARMIRGWWEINLDHYCQGITMGAFIVCGFWVRNMGRQTGRRVGLHRQFGPAGSFLPHELDAIHNAHLGSHVRNAWPYSLPVYSHWFTIGSWTR